MILWMCLYCNGTGCVWCGETGRFDYCDPGLSRDQLKREDEEVGRVRAWLYSTEELLHRLAPQGLTAEALSALRAELQSGQDVTYQILDEAVSKIICIGFDYARLVEVRRRTPAPSELARELTAKAKHLRASAAIVKEAESGRLFLPSELMPEVGYWETRTDAGAPSPKYISEDIRKHKLDMRIIRIAEKLEEHAYFMKSIVRKISTKRNNMFYVYILINIRNRITNETWLKIGGHEHKLSPLLSFLCLATQIIPKTSSGRTIEGLSAANLRRHAVEAQWFGATETDHPA